MLCVVPSDEVSKPLAGMLKGREAARVANGILQGFVPGLDEGLVVAAPWAGIAPYDLERVEEDGQRDAPHGIPVIGMDDLGADAQAAGDPLEEPLGVLLQLGRLDCPTHDALVEQVDNRVGVEKSPANIGPQLDDVP